MPGADQRWDLAAVQPLSATPAGLRCPTPRRARAAGLLPCHSRPSPTSDAGTSTVTKTSPLTSTMRDAV